MYRHIVMFRWREDATEEARRAAIDGMRALPGRIDGVRAFACAENAGAAENHDVGVVVDFDDEAAYRHYAEHPAHVELVTDTLRPIIAERAAVQHHFD